MAMHRLLEKLIEQGKIPQGKARGLMLGTQSTPLAQRLIQQKMVGEEDIIQAYQALGNPQEDNIIIATDVKPDIDALTTITGDMARRDLILPISIDDDHITIAIPFTSATNVEIQDNIRKRSKREPIIFLSSTGELQRAIENQYRAEGELRQIVDERNVADAEAAQNEDIQVESIANESGSVKFVNIVLQQAIEDRASDIHIEQSERHVIVRYRIDGVLKDISDSTPKSMANEIITRIKIMCDMDIAERRKPQDGRLSINHAKRGKIDMRVACLPTVHGEKIVMRILDNSQASNDLAQLGFSEDNLDRFRAAYTKPYGMLLVTGPTGSGKSTTLYAALNDLVSPDVNIITVEDPVEYQIERINQVQVAPKAGLTFASALRSILRADPDILLIGEIRDEETARIAVEAAQTGHLVLSTLHTNDAPSAVGRLVDLGVEPFLVGTVMEAIIAQRLVRRLCNHCKEEYTPEPEELNRLAFPWTPGTPLPQLYQPKGCKNCADTGYRGRVAIHEVLVKTPELEKVISREGTSRDISEQAKSDGMKDLRRDGFAKAQEGLTSLAEILRVVA